MNFRKLARSGHSAAKSPAPAVSRHVITPHDVQITNATITANFPGNSEDNDGGELAAEPNAATNGTQILESTGDFMRVYNNDGGTSCHGVGLQHFLHSPGPVEDARVQYDNASHRFSLIAGVAQFSGATVAMYVSASQTSDPCGTWNTYRLTFTGDATPAGTEIAFPTLGQDSRALLIGAADGDGPTGAVDSFIVFAISKADVYANNPVTFPVFTVDASTIPTAVSDAGNPVIDSPSSYFMASGAGPFVGIYTVYRMDGSGSASPTVNLQTTITKAYFDPAPFPQPGTSTTLDAANGIESAVFDGQRIWFAQAIDATAFDPGGPTTTVRFGFIDIPATPSRSPRHAIARPARTRTLPSAWASAPMASRPSS